MRDSPAQTLDTPLIVHVVRQYKPNLGGLEDVVANLCRLLPTNGFRVRVVTCNSLFSDPQAGRLPAHEVIDGVEVVRVPWAGSPRYPLAPAVFRHLADADIVHVHAIDFFFDALSLGRWLHRRPLVVTTHGGFFHTQKYAALKKLWFSTLTRLSARGYSRLIACSIKDKALFAGIAGDRASLIENGVDTGKFKGRSAIEPKRRIVTIGRFSVNKRLDRLLDAMAVLARRHDDWHLDIIGVASDLGLADLDHEIAGRGLSARVTVHAGLGNGEIGALLAEASLFASASEYEGFGLAAVEAMSAGLLPILHANQAYRDLATRHPDVLLCDYAMPVQAADRIETAYRRLSETGPDLRLALIEAAQTYAWDAVVERYTDIYRDILGARAAVPPRAGLAQAVNP